MTNILFPTRGGPNSYPNQDKVIEIAKERGADLYFLYVSNVEFLDSIGHIAHSDVIESELDHMGEFLLAMAQERAEKAGWKAVTVVRSGDFVDALKDVIREYEIDLVVLGAPGKDNASLTSPYVVNLIADLNETFNIETLVVQAGEVVDLEKASNGGRK